MRFFDKFKRNNHDDHAIEPHVGIPVSAVIRWCLYDLSIANPNQIAVSMGLSPVSEEGDGKEIEDSNERLAAIYDVLPFVEMMSDIAAKVCTAAQLRELEEVVSLEELELTEEALEKLVDAQKAVAFSAITAALSSGIELGIIQTNTSHIHSWKQEQHDN